MEILTRSEITQLEKEFKADAASAPQDVKDIFCKGWPVAKAAIEALIKVLKNPIVLLVLQAVVAIGDAAQKAFCPQT